jgi:hypothetical protein
MAGYECFRETYFYAIYETLISATMYSQFRSIHEYGASNNMHALPTHNVYYFPLSCVRQNFCTSQQLFYYTFPIMLFRTHLIVLPVLILTHWGIGLFCFNFFASFRLILNVLCADCKMKIQMKKYFTFVNKTIDNIQYDARYKIRYTN